MSVYDLVMKFPFVASFSGVSDTFNRANSTTGIGTADSGQTWEALTGVNGISSNEAYGVSFDSNFARSIIDSGLSDFTLTCDITKGSSSWAPRLIFRVTDNNNMIGVSLPNGQITLYKRVGGAYISIASVESSMPTATYKIVCNGTSVKVYVDDVIVFDEVITDFTSVTKHGISVYLDDTVRYNNFVVAPL